MLACSTHPDFIVRNFKTDQMKAALEEDKEFAALKITIADDPVVADVVSDVSYPFAWHYQCGRGPVA